jgi:hypothetical protein
LDVTVTRRTSSFRGPAHVMIVPSTPLHFLGHYYDWKNALTLSAATTKSMTDVLVRCPCSVRSVTASQEGIGVCHLLIQSIYDVGSEYRKARIGCAFAVFGRRENEGDIRRRRKGRDNTRGALLRALDDDDRGLAKEPESFRARQWE